MSFKVRLKGLKLYTTGRGSCPNHFQFVIMYSSELYLWHCTPVHFRSYRKLLIYLTSVKQSRLWQASALFLNLPNTLFLLTTLISLLKVLSAYGHSFEVSRFKFIQPRSVGDHLWNEIDFYSSSFALQITAIISLPPYKSLKSY